MNQQFSKEQIKCILDYAKAVEVAKQKRQIVDEIAAAVLNSSSFFTEDGVRVTNLKETYLLSDEDYILFIGQKEATLFQRNITSLEEFENGICPALKAEGAAYESFKRVITSLENFVKIPVEKIALLKPDRVNQIEKMLLQIAASYNRKNN